MKRLLSVFVLALSLPDRSSCASRYRQRQFRIERVLDNLQVIDFSIPNNRRISHPRKAHGVLQDPRREYRRDQ